VLVLGKCRFICCPKTGSRFCTAALIRSTPNAIIYDGTGERYHVSVDRGPGRDRPAFGFVRHPVTWYESYWRHRMSHGWTTNHDIDRDCRSDDLNQFVESVLDQHCGWLGRYFEQWLGTDYQSLAYVGRFESLLDDLCKALEFFKQPFDEEKLRATSAVNVGDKDLHPAELDESLRQRIMESEHRLMSRFYEQ